MKGSGPTQDGNLGIGPVTTRRDHGVLHRHKELNVSNIYFASSWRNEKYPEVLEALRDHNHTVYDFRNPEPGSTGSEFSWSGIDPNYQSWLRLQFAMALQDPVGERQFARDLHALNWCDILVLLLPCGRSAHLEAGYIAGLGKQTLVLMGDTDFEPELVYGLLTYIPISLSGLLMALEADTLSGAKR
jgi:hypothetical protein